MREPWRTHMKKNESDALKQQHLISPIRTERSQHKSTRINTTKIDPANKYKILHRDARVRDEARLALGEFLLDKVLDTRDVLHNRLLLNKQRVLVDAH